MTLRVDIRGGALHDGAAGCLSCPTQLRTECGSHQQHFAMLNFCPNELNDVSKSSR